MKKTLVFLGVMAIASASSLAFADNANGLYVSGIVGTTPLGLALSSSMLATSSSSTPLYNGNIGFQFNRFLGLEAGISYNSITSNFTILGDHFKSKNIMTSPDLAAKISLPLGRFFQVYTKLGAAYMNIKNEFMPMNGQNTSTTNSTIDGYVAYGIGINLTNRVQVNAQGYSPLSLNKTNNGTKLGADFSLGAGLTIFI